MAETTESAPLRQAGALGDGSRACQRCGALVYDDNRNCPQCGKFPVLLHLCPQCGCIAPGADARCWKCGRVFVPDGDFL